MSRLRLKFGGVNLLFLFLVLAMILALGRTIFFRPAVPYILALSPDGTRLAAAFDCGPIWVWDFSGSRPQRHALSLEYPPVDLRTPLRDFMPQFCHNGFRRMIFMNARQLAIFNWSRLPFNNWWSSDPERSSDQTQVTVWDIEQDRQISPFAVPHAYAWSVSSEAGQAAFATRNGIQVWDLSTGKCTSPRIDDVSQWATISSDGKKIVGATRKFFQAGSIDVFDALSGRRLEHKDVPELEKHDDSAIVFSQSADLLAFDNQIRRVSTLELQGTLEHFEDGSWVGVGTKRPQVDAQGWPLHWCWLSFGANDRHIAAVDRQAVGVWDSSTGKLLAKHESPDVNDLAVAAHAPVVAFAEYLTDRSRIVLWNTDQQDYRVLWEFSYRTVVWWFSGGFIGLGIIWGLVGARQRRSETPPTDSASKAVPRDSASRKARPVIWAMVISGGVIAVLNAMVLHYYFIRPAPGFSFWMKCFPIPGHLVGPDFLSLYAPVLLPIFLCLAASVLGIGLGVLAITCGVSRNQRVLPLVLKLQVASVLLGDLVNFLLGIMCLVSRTIGRRP